MQRRFDRRLDSHDKALLLDTAFWQNVLSLPSACRGGHAQRWRRGSILIPPHFDWHELHAGLGAPGPPWGLVASSCTFPEVLSLSLSPVTPLYPALPYSAGSVLYFTPTYAQMHWHTEHCLRGGVLDSLFLTLIGPSLSFSLKKQSAELSSMVFV